MTAAPRPLVLSSFSSGQAEMHVTCAMKTTCLVSQRICNIRAFDLLDIPPRDVTTSFMLSEADRRRVNRQRGDLNRLGVAVQLCTLRYPGL
jgi:hypothetical protein